MIWAFRLSTIAKILNRVEILIFIINAGHVGFCGVPFLSLCGQLLFASHCMSSQPAAWRVGVLKPPDVKGGVVFESLKMANWPVKMTGT